MRELKFQNMKAFFLTAFVLLGLNVVFAQTNTPKQAGGAGVESHTTLWGVHVPPTVDTRFGTDNPNVSPRWTIEGTYYAASYVDDNTHMGRTMVYDKSGNVVRTDSEMNPNTYPAAITEYFNKNYPKESFRIWSSMDSNGNSYYYSKRKGKVIWFDSNGNYIDRGNHQVTNTNGPR